jgi:hypothetical protein
MEVLLRGLARGSATTLNSFIQRRCKPSGLAPGAVAEREANISKGAAACVIRYSREVATASLTCSRFDLFSAEPVVV